MNRIRELRKAQNINQATLSALLGVKQQTFSKYETEKISPDYRSLMILADYFHTTVDYLIGRVDEDGRYYPVIDNQTDQETALLEQFRRLSPGEREALMLLLKREGE